MATVTLAQLRKSYDGKTDAVRGVDLEIADGEFLTLCGPSGCGKSTLLHLIAGLEPVSGGTLRIGDRDVNGLSPAERDVAVVFQSYALYPHLSVGENLAFPLKVARTDPAVIAERVQAAAKRLGLEALLGRRPRELSGGQRQRVALGRALVRRPSVFLFDEPLSNLDANLRTEIRGELKRLHEELKATFIYVTHDQIEAMTLSDRIVLLRAGQIEQVGTPRELYLRPATVFAAEFFGASRINWLASSDATGLRRGVRPEHVEIGAGPLPEGAEAGRVDLIEPTGAETWVTVKTPRGRITGRAAEWTGARNESAWVRWSPDREHVFDPATGRRRED